MNKQIPFIEEVLERNGFSLRPEGHYANDRCTVSIEEDHYKVSHYDPHFLEYFDWFSNDLVIYTLMGYLSWNDFIKRGYEK